MYNNKKKLLGLVCLWLPIAASAAQMDYQFNSPSFNGSGYGTYVLTIKQLEDQAKATNKAAADALAQQAQLSAARKAIRFGAVGEAHPRRRKCSGQVHRGRAEGAIIEVHGASWHAGLRVYGWGAIQMLPVGC